MRAFQWLRRLRRNERGNVLVVGAASMPLLIGSAALAVDTIQLSLWKRQLQRAADSGAIAGAYALGQGASEEAAAKSDLTKNEHPQLNDVQVQTGSYGDKTISDENCTTRGIAPCFDRAVEVSLTSQRSLPFISIFTNSPTTITAEAAAALVNDGEYCVVSLYDGDSAGIVAGGNADVTLGCGMITNSRAASAVTAGGSSQIEASPIGAVGGLDGAGQNFVGDTALRPYTAPQKDPLGHIPDPVPPSSCPDLKVGPGETKTVTGPSVCFKSMDVKGTLNIGPGTTLYVNGGDVTLNSQAVVNGQNSVIVMTGPGGDAGDISINGGATINMTAPTSGDHKGVVLYRDRRADVINVKFNGGANLNITGALYLPTTNIDMLGNFELDSQCLQLIGRILNFKGTAAIANDCPPSSGASAFKIDVVRLVG